ncbi:hypothetical protein M3Y96_00795000 [Aphelenchoides besseyi]|nr:hypothetical protein M3Y96_00795000 [Aphelenchoides besseyi]
MKIEIVVFALCFLATVAATFCDLHWTQKKAVNEANIIVIVQKISHDHVLWNGNSIHQVSLVRTIKGPTNITLNYLKTPDHIGNRIEQNTCVALLCEQIPLTEKGLPIGYPTESILSTSLFNQ